LTTDLWCLVISSLLPFALIAPITVARLQAPNSKSWGWGNRDTPLEGVPAWGHRAERAQRNLMENLPTFAIIALVVHVTGHHNDASALGSMLFLGGRVLHALVYIAGLVYVRTAVFVLGQVGLVIVLAQLFD
jgi:uncharacterized MAPEG superfamily protein